MFIVSVFRTTSTFNSEAKIARFAYFSINLRIFTSFKNYLVYGLNYMPI